MDFDSDIIDISPVDLNLNSNTKSFKSTNFGDGIELLMNEKVREGKSSNNNDDDIHLDDLNNLENELNELSNEGISFQPKTDIFSFKKEDKPSVHFEDNPSISIGQSTAETGGADSKTWDGFGKFNNIPMNPDQTMPSGPTMSKEELLREKFKYIRKLEALEKKGVELSKKYTMESSLTEMQGEYETIMEEKSRQNSVKFQGNMMMAVINGIEFLNNRFDPFDVKLDGWGEQINENITDYDEIFGELYEKYKSRASMAPELKLLFQLGGSAMMVHMTNTLFKSAMPGMDDILRQNPDLMRQFQTAAVNTIGQNNPGFGGFMNGIMNPEPMVPPGRGPPPPMATQRFDPPSRSRGGNNSSAVDINLNMTRPNFSNDGFNIRENFGEVEKQEKSRRPLNMPSEKRAEMKGPSDISDILSGLKTKTINIQESSSGSGSGIKQSGTINLNESSTISISDLRDLQDNGNLPKKSKRRPKSDKNTISLDI
jgi:hypothetical protein